MMVCCVSRLDLAACAPIVDRYTTLPGRAASSADLSLAKVRGGIEVRRNEQEDADGPLECRRERGRIIDIGTREAAAKPRPGFGFAGVTYHGPDGLVRG